jgi:hypothetical protein
MLKVKWLPKKKSTQRKITENILKRCSEFRTVGIMDTHVSRGEYVQQYKRKWNIWLQSQLG